jgi:epoxyqueuosine reductase
MKTLNQEIIEYLTTNGASLVGFADLSEIPAGNRRFFPYGISIVLALDPRKVKDIGNGPALEYYQEYRRANAQLDELASMAESFLVAKGFSALARTTAVVKTDPATKRSELPHKTLATRAGLGWIGKCALCITPQFGAAQRFTSVLTDAPLECAKPINKSSCEDCVECQNICPAQAVSGKNWKLGMDRDKFFKALDCHHYIIEYGKVIGRSEVTCGKCIKACPWTQQYLKNADRWNTRPNLDAD